MRKLRCGCRLLYLFELRGMAGLFSDPIGFALRLLFQTGKIFHLALAVFFATAFLIGAASLFVRTSAILFFAAAFLILRASALFL